MLQGVLLGLQSASWKGKCVNTEFRISFQCNQCLLWQGLVMLQIEFLLGLCWPDILEVTELTSKCGTMAGGNVRGQADVVQCRRLGLGWTVGCCGLRFFDNPLGPNKHPN